MSSLWTPRGEVPVDPPSHDPEAAGAPPTQEQRGENPGDQAEAPVGGGPTDEQLDAMRRQLIDTPAAEVVAQHVMALYELAALHLAEAEPRLSEARTAIDAVEALLDKLEGRLGDAGKAIAGALPQLKMAFVEAGDRAPKEH